MTEILNTIRAYILISIFVLLSACFSGSSSSTTEVAGDALDTTESELYSNGPFDLPVTIAKLETVNPNLMSADYLDSGISDISTDSSVTFLLNTESSSSGYVITGSEGATTSEKVIAYNTVTTSSVIVSSEVDGSFTLNILATEGDPISVSSLNGGEDTASPPVTISSFNGISEISLTNTALLGINHNLVQLNGYTFFTTVDDDGISTLVRRELTTGTTETVDIVSGVFESISVDSTSHDVSLLTTDESLYHINSDDPISLSSIVWDNANSIYVHPDTIRVFDQLDHGIETFTDGNNNSFICVNDTFDALGYNDTNTNLLHIAADGTRTIIADDSIDVILDCELGADGKLYVLARPPAVPGPGFDAARIYKLTLSDGVNALTNASTFHVFSSTIQPRSFDISQNLDYVVLVGNNSSNEIEYVVYDESANTETTVYQHASGDDAYPNYARISSTGMVVACTSLNVDSGVLAAHRFGTDSKNEFYKLTDPDITSACNGSFEIDEQDFLVYFKAPGANILSENSELSPIQLNIMNLNSISFSSLSLDS